MIEKPSTPELDKMSAIVEKSQCIGEFLEWLAEEKHLRLWKYVGDDLVENRTSTERLLAEYFKIDLPKVEQEKRVILAYARTQSKR
jgi:hypothetical protein